MRFFLHVLNTAAAATTTTTLWGWNLSSRDILL
jgi:hypothetical protein